MAPRARARVGQEAGGERASDLLAPDAAALPGAASDRVLARTLARLDRLDTEMGVRFARLDERLTRMEARLDGMPSTDTLWRAAATLVAAALALVGGTVALIGGAIVVFKATGIIS